MKTIIFSATDVGLIINQLGFNRVMDEAIDALHAAFLEYDENRYSTPIRDGFEYHQPDIGLIEWMPTMAINSQVVLKVVGYHPSNPSSRQLPSVLSTALNMNTQTGHVEAVMDCTLLTAIRTGAASAVASRILAPQYASVLGLIGCGAQAVTQLHALSRVFPLTKVIAFDSDLNASYSFRDRVAKIGLGDLDVTISSLNEVVESADIICTTTSVGVGKGPVFDASGISNSIHINAVGSDFPGKVEVPHALLTQSLVCPDFRIQAIKEGECQQLDQGQIGPDIVELVKNQNKFIAHRSRATVFDSTGWALEDFVMVNLLTSYGKKLGCGSEVQLACVASDPKNPYSFVTDVK